MQDVQKRAPGYGSKWFGMLLAIVVTCVSLVPTIQIAHAYDSGVCNAGTRLCDQGQAYLNAIKEGNEAICIGGGINTHASLVLDLAYDQRYQAVVQCYRAFDNFTSESGLGESFYPLKCSARPTFTPAAGSTGNLCQEGCEYTVSNNGGQPVATPNGAVCSPPPPLDPGKNNGCCDGSTGPTTAGNPANVFTGTKLETAADYRAPAGHLEFERYAYRC